MSTFAAYCWCSPPVRRLPMATSGTSRAAGRTSRCWPGPREPGRASTRPRTGRAQRGAARAVRRRCGWSGWTATRRRWPRPPSGSRPFADRATLVHAVYDELAERARRPRAGPRPGRAVRPRCLLAAARRAATAASPTPRTRRWTCGWTRARASPPPTSSTPTPGTELARVLREYGEERFARRDRATRSSASGSGSRSPAPRGSPSWCAPRSRPPPGAPAGTPPSGPSRRCASRSTASSPRWSGRSAGRGRRARGRRAASSCCPTTRSRTGW